MFKNSVINTPTTGVQKERVEGGGGHWHVAEAMGMRVELWTCTWE